MRGVTTISFLVGVAFLLMFFMSHSVSAQVVTADLLWSADTYTPVFYGGRALATPESLIYVTLFPLPSASLTYEWRVDDRLQSRYSGIGARSMWFTAHATSDYIHKVEVSREQGFQQAKQMLIDNKVGPIETKILSNPLNN